MLARARSPFPAISAVALALALSGLGSHAHAGPWIPAPGEYYSELSGFRGVADTYYDAEGTRYPMRGGTVFERRSLGAYTELGWKRRLAFIVSAPVVSLTHRINTFSRTETGLGDALIGFRLALATGARALALEADWQAPLGYQANDRRELGATLDSVPSLGSGRQEASSCGLGHPSSGRSSSVGQRRSRVDWSLLAPLFLAALVRAASPGINPLSPKEV